MHPASHTTSAIRKANCSVDVDMVSSIVRIGVLAALVAGCGQNPTNNDPYIPPTGVTNASGEDSADDGDDTADSSADDEGGSDSGSPDTGDSGGHAGAGLPCEVNDIIHSECRMCHSDPPKFGAPMALASHEDFQIPALTDPAKSVAAVTNARLVDQVKPMPPSGTLSPEKLGVLTEWINAGAPLYEGNDCDDPGEPPPGGGAGPDTLPCEPTVFLEAHAPGSQEGYHVPVVDDLYMCYTFKSPFAHGEQGIAWAPIIDDERVLHHWILYKTGTQQADGGAGPCAMPGDAQFVAGWAPGGDNAIMPEDVGLELATPDEYLILQVHYNNVAGHADAIDKSGVAMCTTPTPRPNTAGILWLGSVLIGVPPQSSMYPVTGTCSSNETSGWPSTGFHVMSSSPHMHELGRAFNTTIHRGGQGGPTEVLIDEPQFSFSDQRDYPNDPPVVIMPGDSLESTCYFDNPSGQTVYFGEGTSDEMCFNFVMGYPIDQIPDRWCGILF